MAFVRRRLSTPVFLDIVVIQLKIINTVVSIISNIRVKRSASKESNFGDVRDVVLEVEKRLGVNVFHERELAQT